MSTTGGRPAADDTMAARTTVVRECTAPDAVAVAALLGELGYPATPESVPGRLARLAHGGRAVALAAVRGDVVVGLATVHLLAGLHASNDVAQLTALVVTDTARRHGVGRQLVSAAEEWARSRGCQRIFVTTALHRHAAHAFYERLGYEHTGRRYAKPLGADA